MENFYHVLNYCHCHVQSWSLDGLAQGPCENVNATVLYKEDSY